ncbi:MAG: hypothetical protein HY721_24805 [Planctomycetes bacterium]|nr:hypothetical protein [Planctomycetota bacterium]
MEQVEPPAEPVAAPAPIKPNAAAQLEAARKTASGAAEAAAGAKSPELADHRQLKGLLPESLPGLKRASVKSEKTGALGFSVSLAEAEYEGQEDADGNAKRIEARLTDTAGVGGLMGATAAWTLAEIDRESDEGYEKSTTLNGRRAFEKYQKEGKHGELQVIVADRFLVEVSGDQVTMEELKAALGKIDLAKLEALKGPAAAK